MSNDFQVQKLKYSKKQLKTDKSEVNNHEIYHQRLKMEMPNHKDIQRCFQIGILNSKNKIQIN